MGEKINFTLPGQNGIRVKFYHFWPKNDGEKWSRKNIFEIPPCAKLFFLLHRNAQNCKFSNNKIEGTPILKLAMVKQSKVPKYTILFR